MNRLKRQIVVPDIEGDGLDPTKIHCVSYSYLVGDVIKTKSITDYDEMRKFFSNKDLTFVGHNFVLYDSRVIKKILGIEIPLDQLIDTLFISWYLYPKRIKHGLEEWGREVGVPKVEVKDWENLPVEVYIKRCEEDTKINMKIWIMFLAYLNKIYDNNPIRIINYLMEKAGNIQYQEENPCRYNTTEANLLLEKMIEDQTKRNDALKAIMPKMVKKTKKTIKNVVKISEDEYYKKGDLMYDYYMRENYPIVDHVIEKITGETEANPNSVQQKKAWLKSLGWEPTTFKNVKDKDTGTKRKVEQIMSETGDGSLCPSVLKLVEKEPGIKELEGLSILNHRIGLVKGLNRDSKDGYIQATLGGLTATLRLKHKFLVNLPSFTKPYGKEIRGLIIAEENGIVIGADLSNIESRTKNHYIFDYDPEYVKELSDPLFDSHLDTALQGGLITKKQLLFYVWYGLKDKSNYDTSEIEDLIALSPVDQKKEIEFIKEQRQAGKTTNFAAQYGASAATIAEGAKIPLKTAKKLHAAYHKRNKSVQQFANDCTVKEVDGQKWILNPMNKFWLYLKAEKDRFSAVNQNRRF